MEKKTVIVIIITHFETLTEFQKISIKNCYSKIKNYNKIFLCPHGLNVEVYKNIVSNPVFDFIDKKWQSNYFNFNRLKIEKYIYKKYINYDYILFFEPDAYIFKDEINDWVNLCYDNIGGPWFSLKTGELEPNSGNGGFCLRNVKSSLQTLQKNTWLFLPKIVWNMIKKLPLKYIWKYKFALLKLLFPIFQKSNDFISRYPFYEDKFWANIAPIINKDFKVCPSNLAMQFSFDKHPEKLYEMNNFQLPMGAHGWYRNERINFWKDHIPELEFDINDNL